MSDEARQHCTPHHSNPDVMLEQLAGVEELLDPLPAERMFRTEQLLGEGAFGSVLRCTWRQPGKGLRVSAVAVKMIPHSTLDESADDVAMDVEMEARRMARVSGHEHVVSFLGLYRGARGGYALAMELCPRTLKDLLAAAAATRKGLTESFVGRIALQLVSGLAHCHARQVCHRDIKLDNILVSGVTADDDDLVENGLVRIADFGLGAIVTEPRRLQQNWGTSGFKAPELICCTTFIRVEIARDSCGEAEPPMTLALHAVMLRAHPKLESRTATHKLRARLLTSSARSGADEPLVYVARLHAPLSRNAYLCVAIPGGAGESVRSDATKAVVTLPSRAGKLERVDGVEFGVPGLSLQIKPADTAAISAHRGGGARILGACAAFANQPRYSYPVDVFAAGVVVFQMLSGHCPWDDEAEMMRVLLRGLENTHGARVLHEVTPSARKLLVSMLAPDERDRPTAAQLHAHPWMNNVHTEKLSSMRYLVGNEARRKLRGAVQSLIANGHFGRVTRRLLQQRELSQLAAECFGFTDASLRLSALLGSFRHRASAARTACVGVAAVVEEPMVSPLLRREAFVGAMISAFDSMPFARSCPTAEQAGALFDAFEQHDDKDGGGVVDFREVCTRLSLVIFVPPVRGDPEQIRFLFEAFDLGGKGAIALAQFKDLLSFLHFRKIRELKVRAKPYFDLVDVNHDDLVDVDEFVSMMRHFHVLQHFLRTGKLVPVDEPADENEGWGACSGCKRFLDRMFA